MKKIFILFFALMICTQAKAQFTTGQKFIGGSFYTNFNNLKAKYSDLKTNDYDHNIAILLGRFVKDNKAVGWTLRNNLSLANRDGFDMDTKALRNLGVGVDRFLEFHKPIGTKFSVYVSPSVGLTYNLTNTYTTSNDVVIMETQTNKLTVGASLGAGIVWKVAPKWALYGNFAFINPVNISGLRGDTENYLVQSSQGGNLKTKTTAFDYSFSPSLSSGSIGLGFRYFPALK